MGSMFHQTYNTSSPMGIPSTLNYDIAVVSEMSNDHLSEMFDNEEEGEPYLDVPELSRDKLLEMAEIVTKIEIYEKSIATLQLSVSDHNNAVQCLSQEQKNRAALEMALLSCH